MGVTHRVPALSGMLAPYLPDIINTNLNKNTTNTLATGA
jgi:hypothetical protein